jgi:DNA-binding IscR family transcriptional regulator
VEAIDGPIMLNECVAGNGACVFSDDCPMQPIWCDAQAELVRRLKSTSFATFLSVEPAAVA